MNQKSQEFFSGIRDELPLVLGVFPFGMIYGILALSAGLAVVQAQAMSAIVFAGSAQFMLVQLISVSTPAIVMIVTGFVINLRHALYSASVAPYMRHLSLAWKGILAYLLTDEAYAVVITHYQKGGDLSYKHWYFLGSGLTLWTSWQVSGAVGIFLGAQIPSSWGLEFTLPLTFIAIVIPLIKDRATVLVALTAGLVAVLGADLPLKFGLLGAALAGIVVGLWSDRK
jgi:4-azaleucine resistance transporter AzlC